MAARNILGRGKIRLTRPSAIEPVLLAMIVALRKFSPGYKDSVLIRLLC